MHPSLKELAVKVAKAKEKEHKPKFSLNGAWPESLCNSGAPDQAAAGADPEAGDNHPLLREHIEMPPNAQLHPSPDCPIGNMQQL